MEQRPYLKSGSHLFPSLLCVLFIGLKLTGYINWSWIWVLSPIWVPVIMALIVAMLLIFITNLKR